MMAVPSIFIRDDDVWAMESVFRVIHGELKKFQIPIIYGVIPGRLRGDMVAFLRREKIRYPALFDIVQHGYKHCDYSGGGAEKYEFGPNRSYDEQYADISRGFWIMKRQFHVSFTPAFVPPYHGFDHNTLDVVKALKIPLFSAGKNVLLSQKPFLDLPARISLNDYDEEGTPLVIDAGVMLKKVMSVIFAGRLTGLVFHHRAVKTASAMRHMKAFFRAMADLRDAGQFRIVLFSEILRIRAGVTGRRAVR